jgi:zinc finger protein
MGVVLQDILIMSTNCDRCGYRDNEVKSGSAISEKGKKITLKVEDREDLSRDILKVCVPFNGLLEIAHTLG